MITVRDASTDITELDHRSIKLADHTHQIRVRPARHEPDLFYTNKYIALIEKELFS